MFESHDFPYYNCQTMGRTQCQTAFTRVFVSSNSECYVKHNREKNYKYEVGNLDQLWCMTTLNGTKMAKSGLLI